MIPTPNPITQNIRDLIDRGVYPDLSPLYERLLNDDTTRLRVTYWNTGGLPPHAQAADQILQLLYNRQTLHNLSTDLAARLEDITVAIFWIEHQESDGIHLTHIGTLSGQASRTSQRDYLVKDLLGEYWEPLNKELVGWNYWS